MFDNIKQKIFISIAFAGIIYLAITIYFDYHLIIQSFSGFNYYLIPILLTLSFLNYYTRYWKWNYYLAQLKIKVEKNISFHIFMSGLIMSVTPGKFGELLKSYLLKKVNNTPISISAPIVFAERATDFLSLTILALIGAYFYDYGREVIVVISAVIFLAIILLTNQKIFSAFLSFISKIKFIENRLDSINNLYNSTNTLLKIKPLAIALILSIVSWGFECYGYYLVLKNFGLNADVFWAFFSYSLSTIVGAISMLPGGLGVTEGSFLIMLTNMGLSNNDAFATTFITRVVTLWFAVIVGIFSLFIFQRKYGKVNSDSVSSLS